MLIRKQIILQSQRSTDIRTRIIEQLNAAEADENRKYKYALAFILGSSLKFNKIFLTQPLIKKSYLHAFYNVFLLLENEAYRYERSQPKLTQIIRRCQTSLLLHFNNRYKFLLEKPDNLLEYWQFKIKELDSFATKTTEQNLLKKISASCLKELSIERIRADNVTMKDVRSSYKNSAKKTLNALKFDKN